jgi:hypothetical protein
MGGKSEIRNSFFVQTKKRRRWAAPVQSGNEVD